MFNLFKRLRRLFGLETGQEYRERIEKELYLQSVCEWFGCSEREGRKIVKEMEGK